jgi:hypothetical protein
MPFALPPGNKVYADVTYTKYVIEDMLKRSPRYRTVSTKNIKIKKPA